MENASWDSLERLETTLTEHSSWEISEADLEIARQ